MNNLKNFLLSLILALIISSSALADVIVNIYGVSEYNCSKDKYRILKKQPMLSFLKTKKWYDREKFHNANYKEALKPYKGLAMSEETLSKFLPTLEVSNEIFNEFIAPVDCENPKDIKF
ncbi:hypothetical protein [Candidatus Pelagibacter sp.]|uniref:hypothetical protein n=1 Tax=Candidatus Pelagibacter sp. TaxID=2024849 RepID=UPI003F8487BD